MSRYKKTICVDFDGVVHNYVSGWEAIDIIRDPPVAGAIEFLKQAVEVFDVHIFSSRCAEQRGIMAMRKYLSYHQLPDEVMDKLRFTSIKPPATVYIDDRAWQFNGTFPSLQELDNFKPWNKR